MAKDIVNALVLFQFLRIFFSMKGEIGEDLLPIFLFI